MHTVAAIGIPGAWQCLQFSLPFLFVIGLYWVLTRTDRVAERLFPAGDWEKRLGWLDIQAERRADLVLRWIGYVFYAVAAAALYGIVWGAQGIPLIPHWDNPDSLSELFLRIPVLFVSLTLHLLYFGVYLLPKLSKEYDMHLLREFQIEQRRLEEEEERKKKAEWEAMRASPTYRSFGRTNLPPASRN